MRNGRITAITLALRTFQSKNSEIVLSEQVIKKLVLEPLPWVLLA
jgi:hypothetical protein